MPNTHSTLSSLFTDIANAIRTKTGSSAQIVADNFPTEIANIPSGGIDPSDATATESDILNPKTAYLSDGTKHTGSMVNRGAVSQTLDTTTTSYTIPQGYHNGSGGVSVTTQTKSATPSGSSQTISADSGKVLSSVSVGAVTKNSGIGQTLYNQGVSDTKVGTAGTGDVLSGKTFTNSTTVGANGGMPNRGAWTSSVTPSSSAQNVTIPEGYHNGNGYVSVGASTGGINSLVQVDSITVPSGQVVTLSSFEAGKTYYLALATNASSTTRQWMLWTTNSSNSLYCISRASKSNRMNYPSAYIPTSPSTDYFQGSMYFMSDTQKGIALIRAYANETLKIRCDSGGDPLVLYQVV